MALCLNTKSALILYQELLDSQYFIDKSALIEKISKRIRTSSKYVCITKPRRFGKTSVLSMLGAYYCSAYNTSEIFSRLNISKSETYTAHLNRYDVIHLCLNRLSDNGSTYEDYISLIRNSLKRDILEAYPGLQNREFDSLPDILAATDNRFIFLIDEWDYIFSHELFPEHHGDFLEFLRNLLKDQPYVALAYMTGVLPIKKYSTGSALNMFQEYTMLKDPFFDEYFGFTENEVKTLCGKQSALAMDEINNWYNGYQTRNGARLYNPRSVVCALEDSACQSYWTKSGKTDEVLFFLKYNIADVRDDVVKMVNNTIIRMDIEEEYTAGQKTPENRTEIYSAMIIYGLLSYHDGEIRIPNRELMLEYQKALKDDGFGYVAELVRNSDKVLDATLNRKGDIVASLLHNIHNSELPVLKYNDENSLSCVVTLAYLSARNKYTVEREEKSGKGFADFIFYPLYKNMPGIILELKADDTPEAAIAQIKDKEYCEKLKKEKAGTILAVGLVYDTRKKEHRCIIEEIT